MTTVCPAGHCFGAPTPDLEVHGFLCYNGRGTPRDDDGLVGTNPFALLAHHERHICSLASQLTSLAENYVSQLHLIPCSLARPGLTCTDLGIEEALEISRE